MANKSRRNKSLGLVRGKTKHPGSGKKQDHGTARPPNALAGRLEALGESLDGQRRSLKSISGGVTAIERLISERIEDRHLALLGKSLEVTARLESQWAENREKLQQTASALDEAKRRAETADAEREVALREYDAALAERDAAVAERDSAVAERDSALAEYKAALDQRDAAAGERDAALGERDAAVTERDAALAEYKAALKEIDRARRERARALDEREQTAAKQRQAQGELATTREELERASHQLDNAEAELVQLQERFSWKLTAPLRAMMKLVKGPS